MTIEVAFGGTTIKRPGSYSIVDVEQKIPIRPGAFRTLAFVGLPGVGGVDHGTVYYYNNPTEAAKDIKHAETLDCMNLAWRYGADLIAFSPVKQETPLDADWQDAIDLLEAEFIDGIVLISHEGAVQAKVNTHTQAMSTLQVKKRRRGFFGHASGMTAANIITQAGGLNISRAVMVSPAPYTIVDGVRTLQPSYYAAAAVAGLWASLPVQEPITYKYLDFAGLEVAYTSAEVETLLDAGIVTLEAVRNRGYRIIQGRTLYSGSDLSDAELSLSTLKDELSTDIERFFEDKYVGKGAVAGIEVTMFNDLISLLENYITRGWISGYVPETVQILKEGTAFMPQFEAMPTLPINNFLITSSFKIV